MATIYPPLSWARLSQLRVTPLSGVISRNPAKRRISSSHGERFGFPQRFLFVYWKFYMDTDDDFNR